MNAGRVHRHSAIPRVGTDGGFDGGADPEEAAARVLAGRYELVRFVGRGGMGEVWEGRDRAIGRRVAVKLLAYEQDDTADAALFLREARTAGALHHGGVVAVFDLGQDDADGSPFLVLEFVDGRDLASVLRDGGVPPLRVVVDWAAQAAVALAHAHDAGVVHRDLKPANLMVTDGGVVKILDFGIARFMGSAERSGNVMGTLAYMSPERFDEQPGDARSDLYSFGCVLYELLTGRVPFDRGNPIEMMNAHLRRTPTRLVDLQLGVPAALEELVLELLAKDPGDRPAGADDVHRRLRALTVSREDAPPPPKFGRRRSPRPATGTATARTAGGITAVLNPADQPATPRPRPAAGDQATPFPSVTAPTITKKPWAFHVGTPVSSPPVVAGGVVYVGSDDGYVYAIDATTGTKKWVFPTGNHIGSSPVVVGGVVYLGSDDGYVYAIDATTGTKKWVFPTGNRVTSSPVVVGGVVYVGSTDKNVYAIDATAGTKKWVFATGNHIGSSPVVVGGVVYLGSDDGYVYAIDAATGTGPV
ncbi:protein kinase domain-containing protein [Embleya hyalina]|uniref:non-specific serine/threonine protein kinase n=1 Tax=Embleya hyalina TaxID=516124 RepID=A0A401Z283_9ACTN|nr:serine/threonine-protein kinase [Embleya hyalina]GCE01003.1 serine/threonine protein kinase [Embleya hyalina]